MDTGEIKLPMVHVIGKKEKSAEMRNHELFVDGFAVEHEEGHKIGSRYAEGQEEILDEFIKGQISRVVSPN